jgi:hypothetical protein
LELERHFWLMGSSAWLRPSLSVAPMEPGTVCFITGNDVREAFHHLQAAPDDHEACQNSGAMDLGEHWRPSSGYQKSEKPWQVKILARPLYFKYVKKLDAGSSESRMLDS